MTPSKPCLKPPNQALHMMAQKNTDAKASECQKCHNTHATRTAEATETRVTAYFTPAGGLVHQFGLDIRIFLLRHITASPPADRVNKKIEECITDLNPRTWLRIPDGQGDGEGRVAGLQRSAGEPANRNCRFARATVRHSRIAFELGSATGLPTKNIIPQKRQLDEGPEFWLDVSHSIRHSPCRYSCLTV